MSKKRTLSLVPDWNVTERVKRDCSDYDTCVDFGCGYGIYLKDAKADRRFGIDAFGPYIETASELHEGCTFIQGDMADYRGLVDDPRGVALFVDSLEHMEKQDAVYLIEMCKQDFDRIVTFIPIGCHPQEPCDGNELQRHLSSWEAEDLSGLGFEVEFLADWHGDGQHAAWARWDK